MDQHLALGPRQGSGRREEDFEVTTAIAFGVLGKWLRASHSQTY